MIYPTATDLLRTIDVTLAEKVEPSLSELTGRSALATVRHLLNFVRVRIEGEGQILQDDIAATRALMQQVAAYHAGAGDAELGAAISGELATIEAARPDGYLSLDTLAEAAARLNEMLHQALAHLQSMRSDRAEHAAYQEIRGAIRAHVTSQIETEGTLVAPAFFGRGPRR